MGRNGFEAAYSRVSLIPIQRGGVVVVFGAILVVNLSTDRGQEVISTDLFNLWGCVILIRMTPPPRRATGG